MKSCIRIAEIRDHFAGYRELANLLQVGLVVLVRSHEPVPETKHAQVVHARTRVVKVVAP